MDFDAAFLFFGAVAGVAVFFEEGFGGACEIVRGGGEGGGEEEDGEVAGHGR